MEGKPKANWKPFHGRRTQAATFVINLESFQKKQMGFTVFLLLFPSPVFEHFIAVEATSALLTLFLSLAVATYLII
ncbi:MAG: hypothetical protein OEZ18_04615 [Candidatus Bathyarchaeota archaeon]|nr:hypothetical protein [Candidatus Bathyarchaeota archaeon]